MKSKIVNHKKDDAVSPVIGVMLMIVVTVVIAAVVALFAGNVVTSTEAAPVVVMEMNAYQGSPDENSKLVMSTRGGDPLELAKLKVVVSDSTGNYDLSFVGLDQRGLGDHLEIGEKLTVFTLDNIATVASSASGGEITEVVTQMKSDFKVGKKLHVMVTFNENAVIFEKDIVIKAGTETPVSYSISFDTLDDTITWQYSSPSVPVENPMTIENGYYVSGWIEGGGSLACVEFGVPNDPENNISIKGLGVNNMADIKFNGVSITGDDPIKITKDGTITIELES